MSNPVDKPWTEDEKIFLLTEILRHARVSSAFLYSIIRSNQIPPRLTEIPLPPGRSLRSCEIAFNEIQQATPFQHAPRIDVTTPTHLQLATSGPGSGSRKRPLPPAEKSTPTARALQPRPSISGQSNGGGNVQVQTSPGDDMTGEPPKKKRGRPSKAELEARIAAAEARGETYPPPRRKTVKKPEALTGEAATAGGAGGGIAPVEIPSTPQAANTGPTTAGSSGKKKRQKAKAESEGQNNATGGGAKVAEEKSGGFEPAASSATQVGEQLQSTAQTIPETQFAHKGSIEALFRGITEHASGSAATNPDVQMQDAESSGTVRPLTESSGTLRPLTESSGTVRPLTESSGTVQALSGASHETQKRP